MGTHPSFSLRWYRVCFNQIEVGANPQGWSALAAEALIAFSDRIFHQTRRTLEVKVMFIRVFREATALLKRTCCTCHLGQSESFGGNYSTVEELGR